jgi:ferredoxin
LRDGPTEQASEARPKLCTGCGICELICNFTKFKVFNPRFSLVKIRYDYEVGRVEGLFCARSVVSVARSAQPELST